MHRSWMRAGLAALLTSSVAVASPVADEVPLPVGALQFGHCELPIPGKHGETPEDLARRLIRWRLLRPGTYGPSALPDRLELVPDTAPQDELHLVYEPDADVLPSIVAIARGAAGEGTVVVHARDAHDQNRAEALLGSIPGVRVQLGDAPETPWLRDFAGANARTGDELVRVDFQYSVDCPRDDAWPATLGKPLRVPIWLEGGNLITDGRTCYATDVLALHNGLSTEAMAGALRKVGCSQTVWLEPVPETIAHIDAFLTVGDPGPDGPVFVLARTPAEVDAETHDALERNAEILARHGTVLRVDVDGTRPLLPLVNVVPFNGVLLVPSFGPAPADTALDTFAQAFPGRRIHLVPSEGLVALDGGPHCLTATVPHAR